ncbi:MAG: hypothetical protein IPK64_12680 [bacterium]|nr:hypothetical protein [bacterium]
MSATRHQSARRCAAALSLLVAAVLLPNATPVRAAQTNALGIFYDSEATIDEISIGANSQHVLYLVLLNPVNDAFAGSSTRDVRQVSGFECGIDPPTGDFLLGVDFPLPAVNVGSTGNLIVGFAGAVPVGTAGTAVLATLRVLSFGDNRDGYLLGTASPPSIPGMMAYVDAEDTDDDLVGMMPASGAFERPVFWFGNWHVRENAQWGAVKSLYR